MEWAYLLGMVGRKDSDEDSDPIPSLEEEWVQSSQTSVRWIYLKGIFPSFKMKLKKVEGTFSFPDPMVNGVLYGWMGAIQAGRADRKNRVTVNFLGENWCEGEVTLSLKIFFQYLRSWIFFLIRERRGRKGRKGGES
jgi:hypothetical protein